MWKILLLLFISTNVYGRLYFNDGVYPELGVSARALAMGNAYISKVDDAMAVWYNPAGLGTVRFLRLHLTTFHFEANKGHLDVVWDRIRSSRIMNGFKPEEIKKYLQKGYRDTLYNARMHAMPNFTGRFFSLGFLYAARIQAYLGEGENSLFEFSKRKDRGPYAGFNISLFGGILKLGGSAILLKREEIYTENNLQSSFQVIPQDNHEGTMLLGIAGIKLTLPWRGLPTFSAKLNNVTKKEFTPKNGKEAPLTIYPSWDLGTSLTSYLGNTIRLHFEVNYRDAFRKFPSRRGLDRGLTNARRWSLGTELDMKRMFFLRLGYGGGFGSSGIGMRTKKLECHLTTYAEDISSSRFRGRKDRRFALSISKGI